MAEFAKYIGENFSCFESHASRPETLSHKRKGAVAWYPVAFEEGESFEGLVDDSHVIRRPKPPVLPEHVNVERDRRVATGFMFNGNLFQSRIEDQKRINGAATLAALAVLGGAQPGNLLWHGGDQNFAWISDDNSLVEMDAFTVIKFGKAAARWESLHVFAARTIKNMSPIPFDYKDNQYWPEAQDGN